MSGDRPGSTIHPVFGELRWEAGRDCWFTQMRDAAGGWIDVSVTPDEGADRLAVLDPAAELYTRAVRDERRILRTAIKRELLELYNDVWAQGEQLTAAGLMERLEFSYIHIWPDGPVPVTLSYAAGELFGGHCVDVELDGQLRFEDINLVG